MEIKTWDRKLGRFLDMYENNEVRINRDYQRTGKVWPLNAKSYLVETVILDGVLPRLLLHEQPSREGAPAYTDIVDGQQRTAALSEFRADRFRLSGVVDRQSLRNKKYSTLDPVDRRTFDNYLLKMERFENATEKDIREVFRRINSYTVPLNPEEQRHAKFQGEFKWFLHRQMELFSTIFVTSGVLTDKQLNRMADGKLLTEIVHAFIYGITTTNARSLKKLYSEFDPQFPLERDVTSRLAAARATLATYGQLPKNLAKHFHAYALILAILQAQTGINALAPLIKKKGKLRKKQTVLGNLSTLAGVLDFDEEQVPAKFASFYKASAKGTNVRAARATRFRWYYRAITKASL